MKYRVLIVEDQMMPRQLFEIFVKNSNDFTHVASLTDASLALTLCENQEIDLILMDVCTARGSSGLLAAKDIKEAFPNIKIVIVTSLPEYSWLTRAKQYGIDSFWYKEANEQNIIEVMKKTMKGEHIYPNSTPTVKFGNATNHDLTDREMEILKEMLTGNSNAEIGKTLCISPGTVKRHVENMLMKTGLHTRTELAAEAGRLGIVIRDN